MNRKEAKEFLPIIQAFADGEQVQVLIGNEWHDMSEPAFSSSKYRIKPKPREFHLRNMWANQPLVAHLPHNCDFNDGCIKVREVTDDDN